MKGAQAKRRASAKAPKQLVCLACGCDGKPSVTRSEGVWRSRVTEITEGAGGRP